MTNTSTSWADKTADFALRKAKETCLKARIDPDQYEDDLTTFVIEEMRIAISEMAHDKTHGGPAMAYALNQPFYQEIYISDASRRAAERLISQVQQQQPLA